MFIKFFEKEDRTDVFRSESQRPGVLFAGLPTLSHAKRQSSCRPVRGRRRHWDSFNGHRQDSKVKEGTEVLSGRRERVVGHEVRGPVGVGVLDPKRTGGSPFFSGSVVFFQVSEKLPHYR